MLTREQKTKRTMEARANAYRDANRIVDALHKYLNARASVPRIKVSTFLKARKRLVRAISESIREER